MTALSRPGPASPAGGRRSEAEPLRVLCISHSAICRTNGRLRYGPLLDRPGLQLRLVMPDRWFERGRWLAPDFPRSDEDWVDALPVRWPKAGPATWHLHHYLGLDRVFRRFRPQVVHLWQEPWSLVTLQALRLRDRFCPNAPLVLEVDQNILKRLPPPFEQIRRRVLRHTASVLGRSDEAIRVVRACGYAGPTGRIAYGVDRSVFRPAARDGAGRHNLTVGYVGRLVEEKGVSDLIEAAGRAAAPVEIAIMGEGPHRQALLDRAAALGLGDRVRVQPWGPPEAVARFMAGLDALALLTRTTGSVREQFGRVIIEAQACGTPVIGSACGAIPEVVGDGGWIVPERAPDTVAALLDRLANHPAELAAARRRAAQRIAGRYDYAQVADALSDAWQQAAARARR